MLLFDLAAHSALALTLVAVLRALPALGTVAREIKSSAGSYGGYRAGHAPDPEKPPSPAPDPEAPCAATPPAPPAKAGSANIVMFLMDDMDLKLGSWKALTKTTKLLSDEGATAENWMIHVSPRDRLRLLQPLVSWRRSDIDRLFADVIADARLLPEPLRARHRPVLPQHPRRRADGRRLHARQRHARQ